MKVFHYRKSLAQYLSQLGGSIGYVPTMGALHSGHLELVKASSKICTHTVVSIFVNPKQFNNPADLLKYPKTVASDLQKLFLSGADIVFIPLENEIYSGEIVPETDISPLDLVFEGEKRPGHFKGVTEVLYLLFETIKPNSVFFGLKDLQQCLVVEKLIAQHFPIIKQYNVPTSREKSGLAMSSRNSRLSEAGRITASNIYKELTILKSGNTSFLPFSVSAIANLKAEGIETEYLNLVDLPDMKNAASMDKNKQQAIVYAGWLEGVRLIDNLMLELT